MGKKIRTLKVSSRVQSRMTSRMASRMVTRRGSMNNLNEQSESFISTKTILSMSQNKNKSKLNFKSDLSNIPSTIQRQFLRYSPIFSLNFNIFSPKSSPDQSPDFSSEGPPSIKVIRPSIPNIDLKGLKVEGAGTIVEEQESLDDPSSPDNIETPRTRASNSIDIGKPDVLRLSRFGMSPSHSLQALYTEAPKQSSSSSLKRYLKPMIGMVLLMVRLFYKLYWVNYSQI